MVSISLYTFIASDIPLEEYCFGIQLKGNMIIIEDENKTLNIYEDQYQGYPEQYTKLKNIMGVEIGRYSCIKDKLFEYVRNATNSCKQLEVWSVWLDDDNKDYQYLTVKSDELAESDIAWVFDQEYFEHPRCLKIYKWMRGPK